MIQLAHPVDEPAALGLGRSRRRSGVARVLAGSLEELGEPAVGLQVAPDHHRVVRLERLGDPVHERPREPQRDAHLAHGRPRPVRHEIGDHPGVLGAVAAVDVLDDLLPPRRREVDVDIRVGRPALVDEPLEQEVVLDRLDPADAERVRDDRARRAPPTLGRDPLFLREPHQVPADQEELGEAGSLDHVELMGKTVDDGRGQRVVAPLCAVPAEAREIGERRLALGHREAREAVLLEAEIDPARRRELDRAFHPGRPRSRDLPPERAVTRRQRGHLDRRLQVGLAVRTAQVGEPVERPAVADRGQDVVELAALRAGVVDIVGDDDREVQLAGEGHRLGHEPVVVGQVLMGQLEMEALVGVVARPVVDRREGPRRRSRARPIPHPQPARDLAVPAARQGDETFAVLGQQGVVEAGHRLRPGEVRPRDEPAQTPIPDRVAGEQDEMRPALPLADPAAVLLDGLAMTGQASPFGSRPIRFSVPCERLGASGVATRRRAPPAPATDRPATRHDHPIRIRHGRIAQLDLDPENRQESRFLVGRLATNDAVQPLVIGHREAAETQLGGSFGQIIGRRGAVEEREVRVAMELGVGGHMDR